MMSFLLATSAVAAILAPRGPEYCGSLEKVVAYVTSCERNADLANLGLTCAIKMQKESEKISAQLAKSLSSGTNAQSDNFQLNDANLQAARSALDLLEKKNRVATLDLLQYFLNLVHPEELDDIAGDPNQYLRNSPCFGPNKRKLLIALAEMEKNRDGVRETKKLLSDLSGKSRLEVAKLVQAHLSSGSWVKAGSQGQTPVPLGKAPRQSEISERKKK